MEICSDVRRSMSRVRGLHFAAWSIYHLHRHSKLKYAAKPFVFGLSIFTSKSSFVREYLILYKSALTLWTTLVTYSRSHSHDDFLQSDSLLFGCAHVNFGTLLKNMWSSIAVDSKRGSPMQVGRSMESSTSILVTQVSQNRFRWRIGMNLSPATQNENLNWRAQNEKKIVLLFCININIVLMFIPMAFIINFNASFALNPSYPKFKIKFPSQCQK